MADETFVAAGLNVAGGLPKPHLYFFHLGTGPEKPVGDPPLSPPWMTYKGAAAWRDPHVWRYGGRWLMTVTSGGFRWGGHPNVVLFEADDPLGRWFNLGPIIDPPISALFAEMERPQMHHVDGRWVIWWSAWPSRHFVKAEANARQFVYCSPWDDPTTITRPVCNISGAYGMLLRHRDWCAGWVWKDLDSKRGECALWHAPELFDLLRKEMEKA